MPTSDDFLVDPMTAFYAAVTTVENGKINEIDIHFSKSTPEYEITVLITICRESRPIGIVSANELKEN